MAYEITKQRIGIWNKYHSKLEALEKTGLIKRPFVPSYCQHNGHLYYIITKKPEVRDKLIDFLKKRSIYAPFHYVPLHSSPAGKRYTRFVGAMGITDRVSGTLIRLPLFYDITDKEIEYVVQSIYDFFKK